MVQLTLLLSVQTRWLCFLAPSGLPSLNHAAAAILPSDLFHLMVLHAARLDVPQAL